MNNFTFQEDLWDVLSYPPFNSDSLNDLWQFISTFGMQWLLTYHLRAIFFMR